MIDWRDAKGRFQGTERYVFSSRALAEWWAASAAAKIPLSQGYKPDYWEIHVIDDMDEAERMAKLEG